MIQAAIITVGSEILTGSILNTNAQYLADQLTQLGFVVDHVISVGDNKKNLEDVLKNALKQNTLILITGGLGPTMDDLTMETVAQTLGLELVIDEAWLEHISEYFNKRGIKLTKNNAKQALLPINSVKIDNPNGTACGALIEEEGKILILLPGVPTEMQEMFTSLLPKLNELVDEKISISRIMLTGIGESSAEDKISDIVAQGDATRLITTYASPGEIELRITSRGADLSDWNSTIESRLGKYIFTHRNEKLHETVARFLMENGLTITTAESCTGGLIGEMLTRIPGISSVFKLGLTTYSNEAKERLLGVKHETLKRFGAVSEETCKEMCVGARRILDTDIGISVTGIAGPGGGSIEKPVGLVYTGIATPEKTLVKKNIFTGTREMIQRFSANKVFQMIREIYFKIYD